MLLIVGLTCAATDPQMVEPGYCLEHVYEPSLVVPNHIAVSPSGVIVVTEWSEGRRVVRVHEDSSLSTYAQPSPGHHFGVIFDAANNLYVGDGPNNLWRVSPTGEVTLVAVDVFGFNLDIGPSGDVFAVGGSDACVQRITPAGDVSVYADGFVGASELAVCPITEEVFVFDLLAGTIWRAVPGGAPVALATGLIHEVSSIAVAPDGTLYLSSMGHLYTVSRVDGALNELEWLAGIAGNLHPGEMDFDSSGRLIATGHLCIVRLDMDEETAEVLMEGYGHSEALGVAPDGGIYVGSSSPLLTIPGSVVRIEPDGTVTPFVEGLLTEVCGFVVRTVELGYVVSSTCDSGLWTSIVHEVDMATGAKTEYATLPTHGRKLAIDPVTGFLWGLCFAEIWYFDGSDVRHSLFPAAEGIGVESIAFTPDGTLYVNGYTTDIMGMPVEGALYRVDDKYGADPSYVSVADLSTVAMCCPLGNIAGGMDGNIYWVGHGDHYTPGNERDMHMLRITPAGDVTLIGYQFPMDPFAITADPASQDLYFTSGNGVYRAYQMPLTTVTFPDVGLEGAIRDAVGKPVGDIYDWDLIGLSDLDSGDRGIVSLEGLQYCTNLAELCLWNNAISDISILSGATGLTALWLDNNQINDISALSGLTDLASLYLGGNQLADIGPLAGLTNLMELCLWDNTISDVGALSGLDSLAKLWLDNNQISDISAFSGLTDLTWLFLGGNQLTDISSLSGLVDLIELDVSRNQVTDIGPLVGLTRLAELRLSQNQISDVGPLAGLTNLETLHLDGNSIADAGALSGLTSLGGLALQGNLINDVTPLAALTGLEELWLDDNQIGDIAPLSGLAALSLLSLRGNEIVNVAPLSALSELRYLELSTNQIVDVTPLAGLVDLTTLALRENPIGSIAPLSGMSDLEVLWLDGIQLDDVGPLSGLTNLRELYLNFNEVVDVEPLAELTGLTLLDMHANRVCDVVSLQGLTELASLDLRENRIADLGPLVSNVGIGSGDYVDVRWNHLNLSPGSHDMEDIDTLLGRGVDLQYDPQQEAPDTSAAFRVETDGNVRCDEVFHAAAFETGAADIAEWVRVATPVEPGTVLELDPSSSSTYRICSIECSPLLAGVVSSAPGITLGVLFELEPCALLALTGIVPVKVTNEGGPIRPGDLLVSSSTPGYAMRCCSQTACPCSILGKALAPMSAEYGVIPVLLMTP